MNINKFCLKNIHTHTHIHTLCSMLHDAVSATESRCTNCIRALLQQFTYCTQTHTHAYVHTHTYAFTYVCMYGCIGVHGLYVRRHKYFIIIKRDHILFNGYICARYSVVKRCNAITMRNACAHSPHRCYCLTRALSSSRLSLCLTRALSLSLELLLACEREASSK